MTNQPLILIVDDGKDFREIIKTKLESFNVKIIEAENGKDGLVKARQFKPDLILIDVVMPEMDGITMLGELKKDPETQSIKAALFSSYVDSEPEKYEEEKARAIKNGAIDLLIKTEDFNMLMEKLKRIIDRL